MKNDARENLDEELARLSRDVTPPNMWPAIAREIAKQPRVQRTPWLAYAAALAAVCLTAGVAWVVLHPQGRATTGASLARSGVGTTTVAASFDEPRDAAYLAARAALQTTFNERLALLDPRTRGEIESNLATIRSAREDLRAALAGDPDSPVLEQLLESAWHDEFDLYDEVVRTTQPILART